MPRPRFRVSTTNSKTTPDAEAVRRKASAGVWADKAFEGSARFFAFFVFILLGAIMASLLYGGWDSISKDGFAFLARNDWDPVNDVYGAVVPVVGTALSALIALAIAVPASFGIAMFLTELAPMWVRRPLGVAIELLAAVPSIIYGMWGLFVFVPWFQNHVQPHLIAWLSPIPGIGRFFAGPPMGIGLFTAGLILSIMIIPYIASVMRDVFDVVPPIYKESAYGLGATTWEVMWRIVLPYTKGGVVGGVMLGLGRALGETMAVTFVIGNSFNMPDSLFGPMNSIASAIANQFNESAGLQRSALLELGLLLFLITTVVLALSRWMLARMARNEGAQS